MNPMEKLAVHLLRRDLCKGHHRTFSSTTQRLEKIKCELLVVGGGSGGCSMAAKYASKLGANKVVIVEPKDTHYYQPMFTLVGGGMKTLANSGRPMASVLPSQARWVKDEVSKFEPKSNLVVTKNGDTIEYNYLLVAVGLKLDYHKVKGLEDALANDPRVCSNYSPLYVDKTYKALQNFGPGAALFTFPNTPIKCAGAPQKIMYIADQYLRKNGKREVAELKYFTSLGVIFGVKKYATALLELCKKRDINVNFRHNLIEVRSSAGEAIFENLDSPGKTITQKYSFLHATPPMSTPEVLSSCSDLADKAGYLEVSKENLQHVRFSNIFGIGDCTSAPTSKTAAAVAAQCGVVKKHLSAVMEGKSRPSIAYDGYTSCPLVTGYDSCILAEFDYDGQPLETFPVDQGVERKSMFLMKKLVMPELYWHAMLKGNWEGPGLLRKAMHFGMGK